MIALALRLSGRDNPKVRQALLAAMAVESNFRNVNYGDRDSLGVLQQRPSQGWGPPGNPAQDIQQFLARARALKSFQGTPGQLAQSVQRSAFPERYDQRMNQVMELLRGTTAPMSGAEGGAISARQPTLAGGNVARLTALRGSMGQGPLAMLRAMREVGPRQGAGVLPGGAVSLPKPQQLGSGRFSPEELFYDPLGAYKHGKKIAPIGGHGSHTHVAEDDPAQMLQIIQLAKRLGLATRENPWVDPVDPVHTKTSYHYRSSPFKGRQMGRGLDVSGNAAALKRFFQALAPKSSRR